MIRKFIEARDRGEPVVTLWGDGSPTREFLYVEDAAEGILMAAEKYDGDDPVNLGSGDEFTIRDLARTIAESVGFRGEVIWDTTRANGQPRRKLDVSRAAAEFGFRARTPIRDGMSKTISWYETNR
jgi:GDP-L-fucose synthase